MPLEAAKRQNIVDLVRQKRGRIEIARIVGVSPNTVSHVAASDNLGFDRTATARAAELSSVDAKSRRRTLGAPMLADIEEPRLRLVREVQPRGFRAAAQGLSALVRSYINPAKVDGRDTTPIDEVKSIMGSFMPTARVMSLQRQEGEIEQAQADFDRRGAEFEAKSGGKFYDGPPNDPRLAELGQGTGNR